MKKIFQNETVEKIFYFRSLRFMMNYTVTNSNIFVLIRSAEYTLHERFFIFLISLFSNTFSAISGGGAGLVQLPALILSGIPYYQALATHKIATVALGLGGSIRNYQSLSNDIFILFQPFSLKFSTSLVFLICIR